MKLKELYDKLFSVKFFASLKKIPVIGKLLEYEILSYIVFGVLTTVVNMVVYYIVTKLAGDGYDKKVLFHLIIDFRFIYLANAIAWIVAVAFAYVTNKLFVFESRSWKTKVILPEILSFVGARIISFLVFEELMFGIIAKLLVNVKYGDWISKLITAVLVVIFNFVASKLVTFRNKNKQVEEKTEA